MFKRSRIRLFSRKSHRDLQYRRADLRRATEAIWWERIYLWLFVKNYTDLDSRPYRLLVRLRRIATWLVAVALTWGLVESILAWNIFDG